MGGDHLDIWYLYDTEDPNCMLLRIEGNKPYWLPRSWIHPMWRGDRRCVMQGLYLRCPNRPDKILREWYGNDWDGYARNGEHATGKLLGGQNPCYKRHKGDGINKSFWESINGR